MTKSIWSGVLAPGGRPALRAIFGGFLISSASVQIYAFVLPDLLIRWSLSSSQGGLLASATLASSALGGWGAGVLSDRLGRVRILQGTIVIVALATACCALANSFASLLLARLVQGLGFGAEWAVGAVYINEIAPPPIRARVAGTVQSAWAWGWALAAAIAFASLSQLASSWAWRVAFLVPVLPASWIVLARVRLQRSIKSHRRGGDERWHAIFNGPLLARTAKGTLLASGVHSGYWALATWWPTMLRLEWHLPTDQTAQQFAFLVGGSLVGYPVSGWLSDSIGRRASVALLGLCGSLAVASLLLLSTPAAIPFVSALIGFFALGLYSSLSPALAELFPTSVRGSGLGFCYNAGRAIAAAAPLAVGYFIPTFGFGVSLALVVAVGYGLAVIAAATLKETRGRDLGGEPAIDFS